MRIILFSFLAITAQSTYGDAQHTRSGRSCCSPIRDCRIPAVQLYSPFDAPLLPRVLQTPLLPTCDPLFPRTLSSPGLPLTSSLCDPCLLPFKGNCGPLPCRALACGSLPCSSLPLSPYGSCLPGPLPCGSLPCGSLPSCGLLPTCTSPNPVLRKVVKHSVEQVIRRVPVTDINNVPVIQKFVRPIIETRTRHVPMIRKRYRTVVEPYTCHVPVLEKFARPIIETVVKEVPCVSRRYQPIIQQCLGPIGVCSDLPRPLPALSPSILYPSAPIDSPVSPCCLNSVDPPMLPLLNSLPCGNLVAPVCCNNAPCCNTNQICSPCGTTQICSPCVTTCACSSLPKACCQNKCCNSPLSPTSPPDKCSCCQNKQPSTPCCLTCCSS